MLGGGGCNFAGSTLSLVLLLLALSLLLQRHPAGGSGERYILGVIEQDEVVSEARTNLRARASSGSWLGSMKSNPPAPPAPPISSPDRMEDFMRASERVGPTLTVTMCDPGGKGSVN